MDVSVSKPLCCLQSLSGIDLTKGFELLESLCKNRCVRKLELHFCTVNRFVCEMLARQSDHFNRLSICDNAPSFDYGWLAPIRIPSIELHFLDQQVCVPGLHRLLASPTLTELCLRPQELLDDALSLYEMSPSLCSLRWVSLRENTIERIFQRLPALESLSCSIETESNAEVFCGLTHFAQLTCLHITRLPETISCEVLRAFLTNNGRRSFRDPNNPALVTLLIELDEPIVPFEKGWSRVLKQCRSVRQNLAHLSITLCGPSEHALRYKDLRRLRKFPQLQHLCIHSASADSGLTSQHLLSLTSLRSLTTLTLPINVCDCSVEAIRALACLPHLQQLHAMLQTYSTVSDKDTSDNNEDDDMKEEEEEERQESDQEQTEEQEQEEEQEEEKEKDETSTLDEGKNKEEEKQMRQAQRVRDEVASFPRLSSLSTECLPNSMVSLLAHNPSLLALRLETLSARTRTYLVQQLLCYSRSIVNIFFACQSAPPGFALLLHRNRTLLYNWQCVALIIASLRANSGSVIRNSILYTLRDDITPFLVNNDFTVIYRKPKPNKPTHSSTSDSGLKRKQMCT